MKNVLLWTNLTSLFILISYITCEAQIGNNPNPDSTLQPRSLSFKDITCEMNDKDLDKILQTGSIKGFLDYDQFWQIYENLKGRYPDFIGEKFLVGYTFEEDKMEGFFFGENLKDGEVHYPDKNILFITGLHHSREPLTVTMVAFLLIKILKDRGVCGVEDENTSAKWQEFFRTNIILFIPIVNIDSYKFIAANWKGPNGNKVLLIRKNRRIDPTCSIFDGGVDLNRNYEFKFGIDNEGSSDHPCSEDYRGSKPFSEPETSSIKKLVETRENIVSGVNMHSYGNAWVYPYNFVTDKQNLELKEKQPKFYKFYSEFTKEMRDKKLIADFGNTAGTIDYSTNGEGGDWLVGKENIYDLDVELGNLDEESNTFYPNKALISKICRYNYIIFREFFWKHNINLILHRVKRNFKKKEIEMVIYNKSLSSLINFEMEITPEFESDVETQNLKTDSQETSPKKEDSKDPNLIVSSSAVSKNANGRLLSGESNDVNIFYAEKVKGTDKVSNPDETIDNKISTTLKGRYYLSIILKFNDLDKMKEFQRIKAMLQYNDGYKEEFIFYLKPDLKKHKLE